MPVIVLIAGLATTAVGTFCVIFRGRVARYFEQEFVSRFGETGRPFTVASTPATVGLIGMGGIAIGVYDLVQFVLLIAPPG